MNKTDKKANLWSRSKYHPDEITMSEEVSDTREDVISLTGTSVTSPDLPVSTMSEKELGDLAGPDSMARERPTLHFNEPNVDLPVSMMSGTVQSSSSNRFTLGNAVAVQEVFNQANVSNTDIRLNIEVHDNNAPIMFGSNNAIVGQANISDTTEQENESNHKGHFSSVAKNLIDVTKVALKNHKGKHNIETRAVQAVVATLQEHGVAIITGKIGDGKTSLAFAVMDIISRSHSKIPIQVQTGDMWQASINVNGSYIVFIDDIFGKSSFRLDLLRHWWPYFLNIRTCTQNGDIYVLITSRKHILAEAMRHMEASTDDASELFSQSCVIDLIGEYALTVEEKRKIIDEQIAVHPKRALSDRFIDEKLSVKSNHDSVVISKKTVNLIVQQETVLGFPLMCHKFISDKNYICQGLRFFHKLSPLLLKEIKALYYNDKLKYFTLVYMFMSSNFMYLNLKNLFKMTPGEKKEFFELAEKCGVTQTSGLIAAVKEAAEILSGVFLRFNKRYQAYEYIGNSVLDAICIIYGKDFPEDVLKKCSDSFICDYVCTCSCSQTPYTLLLQITPEMFELLAERIANILFKDLRLFEALMPFKNEIFVDDFFSYLDVSERLTLFLSIICKTDPVCEHSIIYFASNNDYFLSKLFENEIMKYHEKCWINGEISCTLDHALRKGNINSVKILCKTGVVLADHSLSVAVESGSTSFVNELLSTYEFSVKEKHNALCTSCVRGDIKMMKYLVEDYHVIPSVRCLMGTVLSNSTNVFLYVLHSKDWDEESKTETLDVACRRGNIPVMKILEDQETVHSDKSLLYVTESMNNGALTYFLQTRNWTDEQKSKALDFVCSKGRLDMIKTLRGHGAVFTECSLLKSLLSEDREVVIHVYTSHKWTSDQKEEAIKYAEQKENIAIVDYLNSHTATVLDCP